MCAVRCACWEQDPSGIIDLGGATLDLHGGVFAISSPVVVPAFYGNFRIIDGEAGRVSDPKVCAVSSPLTGL